MQRAKITRKSAPGSVLECSLGKKVQHCPYRMVKDLPAGISGGTSHEMYLSTAMIAGDIGGRPAVTFSEIFPEV